MQMATQKQKQRQRTRKGGRYTPYQGCEMCAAVVGEDYFSWGYTDGILGFVLCEGCCSYLHTLGEGQAREVLAAHAQGRKPYADRAGYVAGRRNDINRGWVVIYVAAEQGLDVGEKYAVSCETHNTLVGVPSIAKARPLLKVPDFCEGCAGKIEGVQS